MLTKSPFAASARLPIPTQQRSLTDTNGISDIAQAHHEKLALSGHVRSSSGPYPFARDQQSAQRRNVSMVELSTAAVELDTEEGRPLKRAKVEVEPKLELVSSPQAYNEEDAIHKVTAGQSLGVPLRPVEPRRKYRPRQVIENPARRAKGTIPPALATRLPAPKDVADFCPWKGNHPEDILNEQVVKNGYSEKGPSPNQNESNTARLTLGPTLSQTNNLAIQTLSAMYVQVLEKRQILGRCTTTSTFKPPPRVTVTDTKREAWLRDLANPAIPLRRQSRTIPHGIRGKVLLEQCIAKAIPLQRAVWLAKCVGANELRAFSRKGVNTAAAAQGESKWIRDWTISVEQFLDDIFHASARSDWRTSTEFAVKLATVLYQERLLEGDHFLDWIVTSLSHSKLDQVPIWLLLTQIYWQDIISFSKRGRALSRALLQHLNTITNDEKAVYKTLRAHLRRQIGQMITSAQSCLILPDCWEKNERLIKDIANADSQLDNAFSDIRIRNERLSRTTTTTSRACCHPSLQLYDMLDRVALDVDVPRLASICIGFMPSIGDTVRALITWATTKYRSGRHRTVLIEHVIAHLRRDGHDTDSGILTFLAECRTNSIDASQVHTIVVSLIRRECFAVGRLFKWLITSGAIAKPDMIMIKELLVAIPDNLLAQHLRNTRASLLARSDSSLLATIEAHTDAARKEIEIALQESTSWSAETCFVKHNMLSRAGIIGYINTIMVTMKDNSMTPTTFCILRNVLELCQQLDALVVLIELATHSEDFHILASVADTISANAMELAIDSRLTKLKDRLAECYRLLRSQQPLERTSLYAIRDMAVCTHDQGLLRLLTNDITLFERQIMSTACSPASDNIIGMHGSSIDTDEEVDAVFASGNTMDEHLMQRVFLRIMQRAEKSATEHTTSPVCRWLTQIRLLEHTTFENIVRAYLGSLLSNPPQETLPRGIYCLVAADCYDIDKILSCLRDDLPPRSVSAVLQLLAAPLAEDLALDDAARYHFEQRRRQYRLSNPGNMNQLLARALEKDTVAIDAPWIFDLKASLIVVPQDAQSVNKEQGRLCQAMLANLDSSVFSTPLTLDNVCHAGSAINVTYCAQWLRAQGALASGLEGTRDAILAAVSQESKIWPILLQACDTSVIKAVHVWTLERLVGTSHPAADLQPESCFKVLDIANALLKQSTDNNLLSALAARLRALQKALMTLPDEKPLDDSYNLLAQLSTLLHVIVSCMHDVSPDDGYAQGRAHLVVILSSFPAIEACRVLHEYILDVVRMLIDGLPTEYLPSLSKKITANGVSEQLISSCFGLTAQMSAWLVLAKATQPNQHPGLLARQASSASAPHAVTRNQKPSQQIQGAKMPVTQSRQQHTDVQYATFSIRNWEVMPDSTPVIGENDSSINLALFGARKV